MQIAYRKLNGVDVSKAYSASYNLAAATTCLDEVKEAIAICSHISSMQVDVLLDLNNALSQDTGLISQIRYDITSRKAGKAMLSPSLTDSNYHKQSIPLSCWLPAQQNDITDSDDIRDFILLIRTRTFFMLCNLHSSKFSN